MESSEKRRSAKTGNRKRATPDTSGGGAFLPDHGSTGSVLLAVNSDSRLPRWASRRSLSPTAWYTPTTPIHPTPEDLVGDECDCTFGKDGLRADPAAAHVAPGHAGH